MPVLTAFGLEKHKKARLSSKNGSNTCLFCLLSVLIIIKRHVFLQKLAQTRASPSKTHCFLQAEGPQCPFGLVFAPCHRAEGKSRADKALNVGRNEAVGSREAGESLFTSPEHCGTRAWSKAEGVNTHRSLPGGSDRRLRGRMFPLTNSEL